MSMRLLLSSTPITLWQDIIHEAESHCTIKLREELESYLVFLLMRYMNRPEVVHHIIANEFLQGCQESLKKRQGTFQEVGDKCLIFSGLFPHMAEKRLVKISYFVGMGQAAYATISQKSNDIYSLLAKHFVPLMDILQCIPRYSKDLLPLEAYELWNETGSQRSFSILKNYTTGLPKKI